MASVASLNHFFCMKKPWLSRVAFKDIGYSDPTSAVNLFFFVIKDFPVLLVFFKSEMK